MTARFSISGQLIQFIEPENAMPTDYLELIIRDCDFSQGSGFPPIEHRLTLVGELAAKVRQERQLSDRVWSSGIIQYLHSGLLFEVSEISGQHIRERSPEMSLV